MLLGGKNVSPKQAGTNEYRHLTSCAMIYSNKAQRSDKGLLEAFGLSKKDIERARQAEDIEQFIMRGAIRCPDFGGDYEIYLYDSHQAVAVQRFLHGHGFADVELIGSMRSGSWTSKDPGLGRNLPASVPWR